MLHRNGKVYRFGSKLYPNHDRYQGEFIEGKREGHGCLTTHNFVMSTAPTSSRGQRYEGMYECGQKHGQGLFHVGDGGTYEGSFEDNL
mmetsp:Transcript_7245/g.22849  ORF Transcript_7245/g.22849 Transcript_7245/m.22849 type:complete len:88 (-) Transcript_7245:2443-2706(-)